MPLSVDHHTQTAYDKAHPEPEVERLRRRVRELEEQLASMGTNLLHQLPTRRDRCV